MGTLACQFGYARHVLHKSPAPSVVSDVVSDVGTVPYMMSAELIMHLALHSDDSMTTVLLM